MTKTKLIIGSEHDLKGKITLVHSGSLEMQKMVSSLGVCVKTGSPEFKVVKNLHKMTSELFNAGGLLLGHIIFCEKHQRLESASAFGISWRQE